jgi:hypothetical protein
MRRSADAVLAWGFWLWSTFIAVGAGFFGAVLNCEHLSCKQGSPSWFQPWTWGDYYVFPEVTYIAFVAFLCTGAFVGLVVARRQTAAVVALACSVALLAYPYFAGLTAYGRALFSFGPLLAIGALAALRASDGRSENLP